MPAAKLPRSRPLHVLVALVASVLLATLLSPAPAEAANTVTRTDSNRTPGRFDLASVTLKKQDGYMIATVTSHERFYNRDFSAPNTMGVIFRRTSATTRELLGRYRGGKLVAEICSVDSAPLEFRVYNCTAITVSRPSAKSIRYKVSLRLIQPSRTEYRWAGGSLALGGTIGCRRDDSCVDRMPDRYGTFYTWRP